MTKTPSSNIEIDTKIKNYNKYIQKDKKDMEYYEKAVDLASYKLVKANYISTSISKEVVKWGKQAYDNNSTEEQIAQGNAQIDYWMINYPKIINITDPLKGYMASQNDIEHWQSEIEKLQAEQKNVEEDKTDEDYKEPEIPDGTGHLYPIGLVQSWTNQLNFWNDKLNKFLKELDEVSYNVDITWLCKKCEWMCRKINYALALLRHEIIKVLNKMYKQVEQFLPLIEPIANFNPTDIFSCLGWVKNVIKMFLGPYMIVIQFIQDFMTYTPPLVGAATSLVGNAATVPFKMLSRINIVADDGTGEKKQIAEVYKKYLNVKMEKITLADIMSGSSEKPMIAEYSVNKEQCAILKNQQQAAATSIADFWEKFKNRIKNSYNDNMEQIWVQYPGKATAIYNNAYMEYYISSGYNSNKTRIETAKIVYEMADVQQKLELAKEKAIKKAEKAQALANRNLTLAAKNILDETAVAEAEKAKADADQALAEVKAQEIKEPAIPWGTTFNSTRYEVYPRMTTKQFATFLTGDGELPYNDALDLMDFVNDYYMAIVKKGKVDLKTTRKTQPYVDFLKAFGSQFPFIEEELLNLRGIIDQYYQAKDKLSELNKRSVFK